MRVKFTLLKGCLLETQVELVENKKGENFFSPFLPQIYHKLNLLMLWFSKDIPDVQSHKIILMNYN